MNVHSVEVERSSIVSSSDFRENVDHSGRRNDAHEDNRVIGCIIDQLEIEVVYGPHYYSMYASGV